MTCNHFAVIYKSKAESLFASLPPFIIIEDLSIYRVFFTHSNLLQYSKENKKMPTDDIKVEYDAFFCHTRSCVYRIFIRFVEFDLGLSLHGLLSPLHRYCAPTLTGIKDSYGCVPFPVYCIIGLQQPPHSQLSTFRYSYL